MPTVEGKKFPYTKKGIAAAKKASARHEKTESKSERMVEYGPKKAATKKASPKDKKVKMGQSKRYSEGYGKEESVGNPGAGVTRRKKVSDAIRRGNMDK